MVIQHKDISGDQQHVCYVSATRPDDDRDGIFWLDTSSDPPVFKQQYDGDMIAYLSIAHELDGHASLYAPLAHVGTGGAAHANATNSVSGFMTSAEKQKLASVSKSVSYTITTLASPSSSQADLCLAGTDPSVDAGLIQTVLSGFASAGGGTVLLRAGNYILGYTITVPSGVRLIGEGIGTCIIADTAMAVPQIVVDDSGEIQDLYINGNDLADTTGANCVDVIGAYARVSRCTVVNGTRAGIFIGAGASYPTIQDCDVRACTTGILVDGTDDAEEVQLSNCVVLSSIQDGISISNLARNVCVQGCRIALSGRYNINVSGANQTLICESLIRGAQNHGIYSSSTASLTISGCQIDANGAATSNTYSGIYLTGTNAAHVKNCVFLRNTIQKYGLSATNTCDLLMIDSNCLAGSGVSGSTDVSASANTAWGNNVLDDGSFS